MEEGKYQKLIEILGNINEINPTTELEIIKLLFKKIMFGDRRNRIKKNLFLEKYNDYAREGWRQLFIIYDKFDNMEKNKMKAFFLQKKN